MSLLAALAFSLVLNQNPAPAAGDIKPGGAAPPLTVSKWVKGDPVTTFEKDKVYVVEFWATWCGPCLDSIPHLTRLQKKYGSDVKFVGVSIWEEDQKLVEPFVKKMGDKMAYTVAMDKVTEKGDSGRSGMMAVNWMAASGSMGIPTAFIIRDGKVQWFGHPMAMDQALGLVVANTFDPVDFANKQKEIDRLQQEAMAATEKKEYTKALDLINQAQTLGSPWASFYKFQIQSEMGDNAAAESTLQQMLHEEATATMAYDIKFRSLVSQGKMSEANDLAREALKEYGDRPLIGGMAWVLLNPEQTNKNVDLDLAMTLAKQAVENKRTAGSLRSLARAYFLKGDKKTAIALQKEAISLAPVTSKESYEKALKEYGG